MFLRKLRDEKVTVEDWKSISTCRISLLLVTVGQLQGTPTTSFPCKVMRRESLQNCPSSSDRSSSCSPGLPCSLDANLPRTERLG